MSQEGEEEEEMEEEEEEDQEDDQGNLGFNLMFGNIGSDNEVEADWLDEVAVN